MSLSHTTFRGGRFPYLDQHWGLITAAGPVVARRAFSFLLVEWDRLVGRQCNHGAGVLLVVVGIVYRGYHPLGLMSRMWAGLVQWGVSLSRWAFFTLVSTWGVTGRGPPSSGRSDNFRVGILIRQDWVASSPSGSDLRLLTNPCLRCKYDNYTYRPYYPFHLQERRPFIHDRMHSK